ncbi:hypothetical protein [Enterococcus sp. AD013-P3]|uniref:hypothetical protein n=1 Tax=Enterococcus sp. AD013-P3 TaxID=3411036 RepID=UPI003BA0D345
MLKKSNCTVVSKKQTISTADCVQLVTIRNKQLNNRSSTVLQTCWIKVQKSKGQQTSWDCVELDQRIPEHTTKSSLDTFTENTELQATDSLLTAYYSGALL